MKTREEAARFIERQLYVYDPLSATFIPEKRAWHYGKCELRQLMDFIYESLPSVEEEIKSEEMK